MKKLVVTAALLVAAASSYAITSDIPYYDVYNVEVNMKTTAAKEGKGDFIGITYRTVTSKTYKGFYSVEAGQFDDCSNDMLLGYEGEVLWSEVNWNDVVRIGKNNTEIEADGYFSLYGVDVYLRGFGNYDLNKGRVSSLNGAFNAFLPPYLVGYVYGRMLDDVNSEVDAGTIGFGTFSVKYSLEASKKFSSTEDVMMDYVYRKLNIEMKRDI